MLTEGKTLMTDDNNYIEHESYDRIAQTVLECMYMTFGEMGAHIVAQMSASDVILACREFRREARIDAGTRRIFADNETSFFD